MRTDATARLAALLLGALAFMARLAQADEDIHDLRGAKLLPGQSLIGWAVLAVLLVALIAYALWRRRRRRALSTPPLSPVEAALARLEAARSLLAPAQAREFCDAVSDVVRQYIEAQFNVLAQQRTTEEFLQQLSSLSASPLAAHRAALAEFLRRCDFVRFSGTQASRDSLEALFETAHRFIVDTASIPRDPLPAT